MADTLFAPVFTARTQALTAALDREHVRPDMAETKRQRVVALIQSVLPDVLETPMRVKRLNNVVGEWLIKSPHTWSEMETIRQEFHDIIEEYGVSVGRVLEAARALDLPADSLASLQHCGHDLDILKSLIFSTWQPFTRKEHVEAQDDVRRGKVYDLDEVIRELQGSGR